MIHAPGVTNKRFGIKLTTKYLIGFIALRHIIHELHEFAHMIVGRILCGVWGTRDFNNVHPMSDEYTNNHSGSSLLGLEGPFVNYFLIWLGALLIISGKSTAKKSWGITVIFASLPFARLFTSLIGGGDEYGVIKTFISNHLIARFISTILIAAILFYPLYIVFRSLRNVKYNGWVFAGFLILPMLLEGVVVLLFFNYLLKSDVLTQLSFMGSPLLVYVILLIAIVVFILFIKNIKTLVPDNKSNIILNE